MRNVAGIDLEGVLIPVMWPHVAAETRAAATDLPVAHDYRDVLQGLAI